MYITITYSTISYFLVQVTNKLLTPLTKKWSKPLSLSTLLGAGFRYQDLRSPYALQQKGIFRKVIVYFLLMSISYMYEHNRFHMQQTVTG